MIIKSPLKAVTIYGFRGWIHDLWNTDKYKLIALFNQYGFIINYKEHYGLIIKRYG